MVSGLPAVSASASMDHGRKIHLSLTNIDPEREQSVRMELPGYTLSPSLEVRGTIITAEHIQDHNTFDHGNKVISKEFAGISLSGQVLSAVLPAKSVLTLELG
jgi:alpha-N-arabinofuranosidase